MTNERLLREGAEQIGIKNIRTDIFLSYVDLLRKWGRRINLSSVLTDREIIIKHLVDSLTVAEFMPSGSRVIDIGTGAGFPGIPLSIHDPSLKVTLLESVGKKVAFLKDVKRSLGLNNIDIYHGRAEEIDRDMVGEFDRVTFRALGSIGAIVALGTPYLDIEGEMVIMKGPRGKKEWEDYTNRNPQDTKLLLTKELELPFSGEKRVIIVAKPVSRRMETET